MRRLLPRFGDIWIGFARGRWACARPSASEIAWASPRRATSRRSGRIPAFAPVLAQQSSRELSRTHRRFVDVLTAATFGVMAEGWHDGFGADADHLKSTSEVDAAIAAGFTTITVDPIHLVPDMPADAPRSRIKTAFEAIDWADLEDDEQ